MDNVALYVVPCADDPEDGPMFMGAISTFDKAAGIAHLKDLLPPLWKGNYVPYFIPLSDNYLKGVLWDNNLLRYWGVSHVVMLQGPHKPRNSDPYYFGPHRVVNNSVLCWYCEATKCFRYFHCDKCAMIIMEWIAMSQEEWGAKCLERTTSTTRH